MPMTDAELVDALARRRRGLPPPPPPFTVHELELDYRYDVFDTHPSILYHHAHLDEFAVDEAAVRAAGGVCFFGRQRDNGDHGWKVATGTEQIVAGDGAVVGWKVTLAFDKDGRCAALGRAARWAMDEYSREGLELGYGYPMVGLRLYRLRRHHARPPDGRRRVAGRFQRVSLLGD
ncbi:hypothetical protein ACP4OV_018379 [Aristida adscensionis]